ncbi:uncharacterized protein METZ01_LOCUS190270, partial [marine metagenome]
MGWALDGEVAVPCQRLRLGRDATVEAPDGKVCLTPGQTDIFFSSDRICPIGSGIVCAMTNGAINCGDCVPATPETSHLTWDKPLLTSATEWLLGDEPGATADLSETLLLLPTQQAGRRLREALATEMAKRGGGLFPPQTATSALMLVDEESAEPVADTVVCLWHWVNVLQGEALGRYSALFPQLPSVVDFNWCRLMAQSLHELRGTLVDASWDCAAVAESAHCEKESRRWKDLAKLELVYRASLAKVGLRDVHDAKRAAAAKPVLPK